jgi:hypothetical protein
MSPRRDRGHSHGGGGSAEPAAFLLPARHTSFSRRASLVETRPDAVAMTKARKRPKCGKINFRAAAAEMAAKGVSNEPEARSIQSLSL